MINNLSANRKAIPARKLLCSLERQITRIKLKSKSILLEFFEFFVVKCLFTGHDMDTIIGNSKLLLAIIFNCIIVVEVDYVIVSLI
jgi:hypothetical protein